MVHRCDPEFTKADVGSPGSLFPLVEEIGLGTHAS
jgi:hypothetical protein